MSITYMKHVSLKTYLGKKPNRKKILLKEKENILHIIYTVTKNITIYLPSWKHHVRSLDAFQYCAPIFFKGYDK